MPGHHDAGAASGQPSCAVELALRRCASGELPANVALTHLFMAAANARQAETALERMMSDLASEDAASAARLRNAREIWRETPDAFATVRRILDAVEDSAVTGKWEAAFDRAAEVSVSAGVALYALGRDDLLDAATAEIVDLMQRWELLPPDGCVLEIGCGSGRVLRAIAPKTGRAIGIDVSARMLEAARGRRSHGETLIRSSGRDLAMLANESFDLVCGVDVFPYLVEADVAATHVSEAARVLKTRGHLLILNYSYRNALAADRAELGALARACGLTIIRNGTREFSLWDGRAFLLRKVGG